MKLINAKPVSVIQKMRELEKQGGNKEQLAYVLSVLESKDVDIQEQEELINALGRQAVTLQMENIQKDNLINALGQQATQAQLQIMQLQQQIDEGKGGEE